MQALATEISPNSSFNKYNLQAPDFKELQKTAVCRLYTQAMITAASQLSFNEGLVFLLPCSIIYQKIGEYLHPSSPVSNRYKRWIEQYSSIERRTKIEKFINIIDQLTRAIS